MRLCSNMQQFGGHPQPASATHLRRQHLVAEGCMKADRWRLHRLTFSAAAVWIHVRRTQPRQFFGVGEAAATELFSKLPYHVVCAARDMICEKRELEQELWGGPTWREHSQRPDVSESTKMGCGNPLLRCMHRHGHRAQAGVPCWCRFVAKSG